MRYLEEKPEGTIFVIPVRLDDCEIPYTIQSLHFVDYPEGYDRLVMSLNARAGGIATRTAAVQEKVNFVKVQIVLEGELKDFNGCNLKGGLERYTTSPSSCWQYYCSHRTTRASSVSIEEIGDKERFSFEVEDDIVHTARR